MNTLIRLELIKRWGRKKNNNVQNNTQNVMFGSDKQLLEIYLKFGNQVYLLIPQAKIFHKNTIPHKNDHTKHIMTKQNKY